MTLLSENDRMRKQLDSQDAKVIKRLVAAYGQSYKRLKPEIDALTEYMAANPKMTAAQIKKSAAYRNLIRETERELGDYSAYLKTEAQAAADQAGRSGLSSGRLLMIVALAAALGIGVKDIPAATVKQAPPDALAFLADYLRKDGPLWSKINALSGFHAEQIAQGIIERVGLGINPRDIGEWITDAYGMGLTDSLRIARTVQLYSYRQAQNAAQIANADVLQGVVWCAELGDGRACLSCVAQHGTVYPVGTICDDHHLGRCNMLPLVIGADNPITQTGEDWFMSQPESAQAEMMGPGKYTAWKEGKFEFSQLSTTHEDDVYGTMRVEASLKSLLGE